MKQVLLIVLLVIFTTSLSTNGIIGGGTPTFTNLSMPSQIMEGDLVNITSTTILQDGTFPTLGEVTFLRINH